jgi:hypothetical protein
MSAAAATVSCSTPRLPTTCPQRRPIASVASLERATRRLPGGQPPQPMAVTPPGQPKRRIGRVDACPALGAPGTPAHHDRPEDAGQQPAVPGLNRTAGDAVGAGHRCRPVAHRLLLTQLPQVEVVLQQLPQQLPTPPLQQLLQLGMPQPRGVLGAQLHGQGSKHRAGGSKRIGSGFGGAGWHRRFSVTIRGVDAANATANHRVTARCAYADSVGWSPRTNRPAAGSASQPRLTRRLSFNRSPRHCGAPHPGPAQRRSAWHAAAAPHPPRPPARHGRPPAAPPRPRPPATGAP